MNPATGIITNPKPLRALDFMLLLELKKLLAQNPQNNIRFVLPTGSKIPPHAHVTEVARLDKKFIDCGGTFRTESVCRLQTWFADDTDHRLTAGKLLAILQSPHPFSKRTILTWKWNMRRRSFRNFPSRVLKARMVRCRSCWESNTPLVWRKTNACHLLLTNGIF